MAEQTVDIRFEDVPLEEARRMGRGPRMDPVLYDALTRRIRSLSTDAVRIGLEAGVTVTTMKNIIARIARDVQVPVTVRRVPGGLVFWRSTDEDIEQARDVASRLRAGQPRRGPRRGGRRRA